MKYYLSWAQTAVLVTRPKLAVSMPIGASVRSHQSVVSSPESEVSALNSRDEEPEEANNTRDEEPEEANNMHMQVPGVQFCNFLSLNSRLPEVFEPILDIPRIQRIANLHTRY